MIKTIGNILRWTIRISLIAIAIPWAINQAADFYIINSYSAEELESDFGFKLGMMVLGTWVILTFFYYNFCWLYWFFKRKYIRVVLWFLRWPWRANLHSKCTSFYKSQPGNHFTGRS
jgi:hypothetical protein